MGVARYACLLLTGLLAAVVFDVFRFAGVGRGLPERLNDDRCELVAGDVLRGGEDLTLWRHGVAIVAAGDLWTTFRHDPAGAKGVGLFAVDLGRPHGKGSVRKLSIAGWPAGARLVGHGLFLSNRSSQLYVINHGDDNQSFVDIFAIEGADFETLAVRHVDRVGHEFFPYHGINDVVEGRSADEIFVSIWRPYGSTPEAPALGGANELYGTAGFVATRLFGPGFFGRLGVLRCTRSGAGQAWTCGRTKAWGLVSANGMAVSPDRRLLLVSSPESCRIFRYNISEGGELVEVQPPIVLPAPADNLDWDEATDRVLAAGIPRPLIHEHAPGDVIELLRPGRTELPEHKFVLRHDGRLLSQFSGVVQYGNTVLIGSPKSPGLLRCTV